MESSFCSYDPPPTYKECDPTNDHSQLTVPSSVLRTISFPTPSEFPKIEEVVSSSGVTICTLQAELSSLKLRLCNLRRLNAFHPSLISPIRKLPGEILSEIFCHLICPKAIEIGFIRDHIWDLMQVCACWRDVIQVTPLLWHAFKLGDMQVNADSIAIRIKSCLKFSRTTPLSISLSPASLERFSPSLLEEIMDHADRFSSLSLQGYATELMEYNYHVRTSIEQRGLTKLRSLTINGPCSFLDLFRNATELEEVTLRSIELTNASKLRWIKVKKLKLRDMRGLVKEFISLLRITSLVEELTWIRNFENVQLGCIFDQRIVLPSLHTLKFYRSRVSQLWSNTYVPGLTDLLIENYDNYDMDDLLYMVKRSASSVQRLHMGYCRGSFGIRCIQELHDIQELTLLNVVPVILEHLQWNPRRNTMEYLPFLQKLKISVGPVDMGEFYEVYLEFLPFIMRSRSPAYIATIGPQAPHPVPLSFIKCITTPQAHSTGPPDEEYRSNLNELEKLSQELGIVFELEFQTPEEMNYSEGEYQAGDTQDEYYASGY